VAAALPCLLLLAIPFLIPRPAFSAECEAGVCGDGVLNPGEGCDDDNLMPGDGCDGTCHESFDMAVQPVLFNYPVGAEPDASTVADLNNDGIKDLLVSTWGLGYLYTYLVHSDGSITQAGQYSLGRAIFMVSTGNLNGDHYADVVTADGEINQINIFFGNGDGTLTPAKTFSPGIRLRSVRVGDIDNDGYDDLVVGCMLSYGFAIYYGDGEGNFPRNEFVATGGDAIDSLIADLNGDGYNDMVLGTINETTTNPSTQIYFGRQNGYSLHQTFPIATCTARAVDLNRDGYPDLLTVGYPTNGPKGCTAIRTFINQGDGTFVLGQYYDTTKRGWMITTGDLNNDGILDLVMPTRDFNQVRVFLGDGQGWFQGERAYPMPYWVEGVSVLDLNQDGAPDIVASIWYSSTYRQVIPVNNENYYQFPVCGDGRLGRGETCDDGNLLDGDGCSAVCQVEQTADTDHDGLTDAEETVIYGTDPLSPDTDHDCVFDGEEVCTGKNPLDPTDQAGCQAVVTPEGDWQIQVTLLEASAALSSDIYLAQPQEELLIKNSLKHVGKVATTGVYSGEAVTFFIRVHGDAMGLGTYDHYSDSMFGRVSRVDAYHYRVSFEDLPVDLADWDFNDVVLLVEFIPVTPAVGIHRNALDEFQATQLTGAGAGADVALNFDGQASMSLPEGALSGEGGVVLTAGLPENYYELFDWAFKPTGIFYKAVLSNGQTQLLDGKLATLVIAYPDLDNDGLVDGTSLQETDLSLVRFDEDSRRWAPLESSVDPVLKTVTGSTDQMGLFALGQYQPFTLKLPCGAVSNSGAEPESWALILMVLFIPALLRWGRRLMIRSY